ncbi:hypothetical protein VMCG_05223 [Cytospora schulzeri]|uniref:Uncharacterized protein n=1 Tax=Cytospora schulzeri TaxID=448051 RepID=A0A423WQT7_9PEZI|nr:hypothetical protein VMCG_05223 [Valsa malicola]
MNPINRIAQLASREDDHDPSDGPPPGWPFNLPSRAALDHLEQALTEDRPRPDWFGSEVVVLDDEDRYVWSWSINTPLGRRALGSNLYEVQDGTTGDRGLMFAHTQRQQQMAALRTGDHAFSRQFRVATALPQPRSGEAGSQAAQATQSSSQAPSAQQAPASRSGGHTAGGGRVLARSPTRPIVFRLPREQASGVMPSSSTDNPENSNRAMNLDQTQSATGEHIHTNTRQAPEEPQQTMPAHLRVAHQESEEYMDQDTGEEEDPSFEDY